MPTRRRTPLGYGRGCCPCRPRRGCPPWPPPVPRVWRWRTFGPCFDASDRTIAWSLKSPSKGGAERLIFFQMDSLPLPSQAAGRGPVTGWFSEEMSDWDPPPGPLKICAPDLAMKSTMENGREPSRFNSRCKTYLLTLCPKHGMLLTPLCQRHHGVQRNLCERLGMGCRIVSLNHAPHAFTFELDLWWQLAFKISGSHSLLGSFQEAWFVARGGFHLLCPAIH